MFILYAIASVYVTQSNERTEQKSTSFQSVGALFIRTSIYFFLLQNWERENELKFHITHSPKRID